MSGALSKLEGVGDCDIKQGKDGFTIKYDSKKIKPEAIAKALVAAGEAGAKVVE